MHKLTRQKPSNTWSLQEAKARFSEVVRLAESKGPQYVTRHGQRAVVVLDGEEFDRLRSREPEISLVDALLNSPFRGEDLDFSRDKSQMRDIEL